MGIGVIINNLTQHQIITPADADILRNANTLGDRPFLENLVRIFEEKIRFFLRVCQADVKRILRAEGVAAERLDATTVEKTMECAYSVFLETDKFSAVPSLRLLLASSAPELQTSLGLKTFSEEGESLHEITQKVFVGYVARSRLFHSVETQALQDLCRKVEAQAPLLFPTYLFDAFQLESQLSVALKARLQGQPADERPRFLAEQITGDTASYNACLRGIIVYLGTLADYPTISLAYRDHYFHHLSGGQTQRAFARGIAEGYVDEMGQHQTQLEVLQANANLLNSSVSRICLPALRLLGMPVEVDLDAMNARVQQIQEAIAENQRALTAFTGQLNAERDRLHRRINEWRASIPERPWTIEVKYGLPFPK